ncbi:MAG: hypothetical protein IPM64_13265 [Phycisphaerales bacterium]|nr:hypothetical protein [Phycisphaerales bacterium]
MIPLSLASAIEVYGDAFRCEITRHWMDHPVLADASGQLRALMRLLQDEAADQFWRDTLGPIRRLAFTFCSTPIPFASAASSAGIDWTRINRQVRLCQHQFPDFYELLTSLVTNLEQLSAEQSSPFIGPLEELAAQSGRLSVVMRNPRMNKPVATYFAENPALRSTRVVSASQLRGAHACDALAVIGPCGWHPEYVFSAPRAPAIHVMSFRWIRDAWKPGPILLHGSDTSAARHRNHRIGAVPRIGGEAPRSEPSPSDILPLDLLPPMPAFACNIPPGSGMQAETVPARLCHLTGSRAVFVASDDGATSLIIDTSETGRAAVRRAPVDELEPGQYLLLRTSGGGDFIAPLADRILGASAATRRSEQAEWKDRVVARAIEQFGVMSRRELASRVCSSLHAKALSGARPENVHYWMSSKCIRPRKEEDFVAILTFAGLEARARPLWEAMGEISRAHVRAGQLIRRMLLKTISETSLEPLERDGEMVFDLGDHDGGALSAFEIVGIQAEETEVPTDRVGVLLDGEE